MPFGVELGVSPCGHQKGTNAFSFFRQLGKSLTHAILGIEPLLCLPQINTRMASDVQDHSRDQTQTTIRNCGASFGQDSPGQNTPSLAIQPSPQDPVVGFYPPACP